MQTPETNTFILRNFAAVPGLESSSLSPQNATGGGWRKPFDIFRDSCRKTKIVKRTRVRISFLCFLALSPALLVAAETSVAGSPSVTFTPALEDAIKAVLVGLCTWLAVRTREQNKAAEKVAAVRVEMERTPPLGEDTARTYATKKELGNVEARLSGEVKDLRTQIDANDKTLRTLIETNDSNAESRAIGTHARIDSMQKSVVKTNRAIGILIGIISVKYKINPKHIDDNEDEG